jgi:hypothetical protein
LCYVKILDDCRAIEKLAKHGHYIQGSILMRSAHDACNLMMHLLFTPEDADLLQKWRQDGRLLHWQVISALNEETESQIDMDSYRRLQDRLNDFVHGNYLALTCYPTQALGTRTEKRNQTEKTSFWEPLIDLCLYSCLVVAGATSAEGSRARKLQTAMGYPPLPEDT